MFNPNLIILNIVNDITHEDPTFYIKYMYLCEVKYNDNNVSLSLLKYCSSPDININSPSSFFYDAIQNSDNDNPVFFRDLQMIHEILNKF